jgi:hypothetical protein
VTGKYSGAKGSGPCPEHGQLNWTHLLLLYRFTALCRGAVARGRFSYILQRKFTCRFYMSHVISVQHLLAFWLHVPGLNPVRRLAFWSRDFSVYLPCTFRFFLHSVRQYVSSLRTSFNAILYFGTTLECVGRVTTLRHIGLLPYVLWSADRNMSNVVNIFATSHEYPCCLIIVSPGPTPNVFSLSQLLKKLVIYRAIQKEGNTFTCL